MGLLNYPGHKYTGPFNKLDKGKPNNKTDAASQRHDYGYHEYQKQGKNPYIHTNEADKEWIENAGNDVPGLLGKAFFTAKEYVTTPLDETDINIRNLEDEGISNAEMGNRDQEVPNNKRPFQGDEFTDYQRDEQSGTKATRLEADIVDTDMSAGNNAGGHTIGSEPGHDVDYIPKNPESGVQHRTYSFGITRGFAVTSQSNNYSAEDTTDGPYGMDTSTQGIINMPWQIIPNSDIGLYMSTSDMQTIYEKGAYEYRVKRCGLKIHDVMLTTDIGAAETVQSTVDKPTIFIYRDNEQHYQNSSSDSNDTRTGSLNYNPNTRTIRHEEESLPFGDYVDCQGLKYWVPTPGAGLTANQILTEWCPQPEHLGGIELYKPGHDIEWQSNNCGDWVSMMTSEGQGIRNRVTGQGTISGTLAGQIGDNRFNYEGGTHFPNYRMTKIVGDVPRTALDISARKNNIKDINGLFMRIPVINTPTGTPITHKAYFLVDYHIEIETRVSKYPMYKQIGLSWTSYGIAQYTSESDNFRNQQLRGGNYGRTYGDINPSDVPIDDQKRY